MLTVSKIFISLLLLIACSCSGEKEAVDKDLFLGSSELVTTPEPIFFSVTARPKIKDGVDFLLFNHFKDTKNEDCKIASDVSFNSKKLCLTEVNELDLFVHGIDLVVNVPPGMCRYLAIDNYWYYNYETGVGPTSVTINRFFDKDGKEKSPTTCTADGTICDSHKEINFDAAAGVATCVYDKTLGGSPNCCLGKYTLTNITVNDVEGSPRETTTETSQEEWGGNFQNCISGPGTDSSWSQRPTSNHFTPIPARQIYDTRNNGALHNIEIAAPINKESEGNIFASNFYTGALSNTNIASGNTYPHYHGSEDYPQNKFPLAVAPLTDKTGSPIPAGNDAYRFLCLDEAYEVIQQINVYVREWNTFKHYKKYTEDVNNITPNPDITGNEGIDGAEGTDCDYFDSGNNCNDKKDWDDLKGGYPNR